MREIERGQYGALSFAIELPRPVEDKAQVTFALYQANFVKWSEISEELSGSVIPNVRGLSPL
jgi:hypothetical protein